MAEVAVDWELGYTLNSHKWCGMQVSCVIYGALTTGLLDKSSEPSLSFWDLSLGFICFYMQCL